MKLILHIWRQKNADDKGRFETFSLDQVNEHMSFLEMLDVLNQQLIDQGKDPVAFEHDCREGICGCCGAVVNGRPHGGFPGTTLCQLHMRNFKDGDEIVIEPWRSRAFPVMRDLIVDRASLDRIVQAGGFVSINTGSAPDANAIPIPKDVADLAMDYAECIGCGACIAACPNGAPMLFMGAKISQLSLLPQGAAEADRRVRAMVAVAEEESFGACTNYTACEVACPKGISISSIARMNFDYLKAFLPGRAVGGGKYEA